MKNIFFLLIATILLSYCFACDDVDEYEFGSVVKHIAGCWAEEYFTGSDSLVGFDADKFDGADVVVNFTENMQFFMTFQLDSYASENPSGQYLLSGSYETTETTLTLIMEEFVEYDSSENEIDSGIKNRTMTFNADLYLGTLFDDADDVDSLYIKDAATGDIVFAFDRIDCSDL
jgi:hypothetical protein